MHGLYEGDLYIWNGSHALVSSAGNKSPTGRPVSPGLAQVGAAATHIATQVANRNDSDGAFLGEAVLALPPAAVFEAMVPDGQVSLSKYTISGIASCRNCKQVRSLLTEAGKLKFGIPQLFSLKKCRRIAREKSCTVSSKTLQLKEKSSWSSISNNFCPTRKFS